MSQAPTLSAKQPHSPKQRRRPAQDRARQRQARLLDAAEKLVAEQGFEAVRIQDIAAEAGCAVGTAYYLFGNKEGLIDALRERYLNRTRQAIERSAASSDLSAHSPAQVIDRFVRDSVNQIAANQGLFRASLLRAATHPESWEGFRDLVRLMRETIAPRLEREFALPRARIEFAMQVIFSTCANALLNRPGPLNLEDPAFSNELIAMIQAYLGLRPN